jgi:hypothetical protein
MKMNVVVVQFLHTLVLVSIAKEEECHIGIVMNAVRNANCMNLTEKNFALSALRKNLKK